MTSPGSININNLNIVTFIKDIYLSLKHLDQCFSTFKTDIDARIDKLAEQHENILEKLAIVELSINQVNDKLASADKIDKDIENELLDKMYKLNNTTEEETRLDLKPKELTIANILENGYTMLDIHNTLDANNNPEPSTSYYTPLDLNDNNTNYMSLTSSNEKKTTETLDNLLFG
jgi:hypothetical protein